MLKLTYADLVDSSTFTSKVLRKHQENIEILAQEWAREKAFDYALTRHLQDYGEMDYELYNYAVALFERSDLSVSEIFQKIRAMRA